MIDPPTPLWLRWLDRATRAGITDREQLAATIGHPWEQLEARMRERRAHIVVISVMRRLRHADQQKGLHR